MPAINILPSFTFYLLILGKHHPALVGPDDIYVLKFGPDRLLLQQPSYFVRSVQSTTTNSCVVVGLSVARHAQNV